MLWLLDQVSFCYYPSAYGRWLKPLSGLTVNAEADQSVVLGKTVSDLQSDVSISNDAATGTLNYITDYTEFSSDPELQSGNFIALHWSDPDESVTSLKVGIVPSSIGMEPQECLNDPDRNGVFRVTDPSTQVIKIIQSDGTNTLTQEISLSGVTCEPEGEG